MTTIKPTINFSITTQYIGEITGYSEKDINEMVDEKRRKILYARIERAMEKAIEDSIEEFDYFDTFGTLPKGGKLS
jgi:hypothetical protein